MFKCLVNLIGLASTILTIAAIYLYWRSGTQQDAIISGHAGGRLFLVASTDHELKVEIYSAWPIEHPWKYKTCSSYEGFEAETMILFSEWSLAGFTRTNIVFQWDMNRSLEPRWGPGDSGIRGAYFPKLSPHINGTRYELGYVAVTVFFGGISAVWIMPQIIEMWRRVRRKPAGLCQNCGYDLRATPERCPECGKSREDAMARRSREGIQ